MKYTSLFVFLLFNIAVFGRAPKEFNLERSSVEMEAEGIEFKPFSDMKADQITPLEARFLTKGSSPDKITVFNYDELWQRGQILASYQNKLIKISFHKLNFLPPKNVNFLLQRLVDENDFKKNIEVPQPGVTFINDWFKAFTGKDIKLTDKYPKLTFSIKQKWVEMAQSDNQYDFLIQSTDKRLFYLTVKFSDGEQKDTEDAVKKFLRTIRIGRPQDVKASNQSSKVKPNGNTSSDFQATVEKVKQEVSNLEGWWFAQTPNYILKSNLSSRSKTFAKKIQERVEVMRDVYEKFIPPVDKISAVSVITVLETRKEYIEYSEAPSWSAGVWNAGRRELIVSQLDGNKKNAEYQMMNTLHHEAFHQYIYYALNEIQTPAWFNEGHADLFAAVKVTGTKVKITEDLYHLRTLDSYFKSGRVDLKRHIDASYNEFYANKDLNYPLAWSVVYFLRKGGEQYKEKGYDKILDNLMKELVSSKSMQKANEKAFYGINMDQFQKDFLEFWNDKRARSKAERNYIIPK